MITITIEGNCKMVEQIVNFFVKGLYPLKSKYDVCNIIYCGKHYHYPNEFSFYKIAIVKDFGKEVRYEDEGSCI